MSDKMAQLKREMRKKNVYWSFFLQDRHKGKKYTHLLIKTYRRKQIKKGKVIWNALPTCFDCLSVTRQTKRRTTHVSEYREMLHFYTPLQLIGTFVKCLLPLPRINITYELFSQMVLINSCEFAWSLLLDLAIHFALNILYFNVDYSRTQLIF